MTHEEDAREKQGSREDDCKEEEPRFAGLDAADGGKQEGGRVQRRQIVSGMETRAVKTTRVGLDCREPRSAS